MDFELQGALQDRVEDMIRNLEQEVSREFRRSRAEQAANPHESAGPPAMDVQQDSQPIDANVLPELTLPNLSTDFDDAWLDDDAFYELSLILDQPAKDIGSDSGYGTLGRSTPQINSS